MNEKLNALNLILERINKKCNEKDYWKAIVIQMILTLYDNVGEEASEEIPNEEEINNIVESLQNDDYLWSYIDYLWSYINDIVVEYIKYGRGELYDR